MVCKNSSISKQCGFMKQICTYITHDFLHSEIFAPTISLNPSNSTKLFFFKKFKISSNHLKNKHYRYHIDIIIMLKTDMIPFNSNETLLHCTLGYSCSTLEIVAIGSLILL